MCLLGRPSVVVCLHLNQFWELREEFHELYEEVQDCIAVLSENNIKVEVFIDKVDHVGQEIVKSSLEEAFYLK